MEQSEDSHSCRAMQCGRRMFLAALILASKYLQDRNYSARAWSKISGLKTCEINTNEMAFLLAVNWKLHIPDQIFNRWTDIVLLYSPSQSPLSPRSSPAGPNVWRSIMPRLTPELDDFGFGSAKISIPQSEESSRTPLASRNILNLRLSSPGSPCDEKTPTNPYTIPQVLEPAPRETSSEFPRLPSMPRLGALPTPQMTPQTSTFSTPAVSASGLYPNKSSMCSAMATAQNACMERTVLDPWKFTNQESFPCVTRRSSLARPASSLSSPESMISDVSSRSSRSSSISSVASSTCALPQPRLAIQATRRCANMQLCGIKENMNPNTRSPAATIRDRKGDMTWEAALNASPGDSSGLGPQDCSTKAFKTVTNICQFNTSDQEAAAAEGLRDLALNRQRHNNFELPKPENRCPFRSNAGRKRERPHSIDLALQANVRKLIAPTGMAGLLNDENQQKGCAADAFVRKDQLAADTFVLSENFKLPLPVTSSIRMPLVKETSEAQRKRACYAGEAVGRMGRAMGMPQAGARAHKGPGMWHGVL
ncbi:hypothetical protein MMC09_001073 [Bachmanniomyces sp. S44760]|nr:hypothetical protein [Bachmanniomyces sp. S44760]